MAQIDDIKLLEEFAATRDEAIFANIVQRHIALVYSTALRRTGNPHAAEEVAQAVFILLARKSGSLPSSTVLSGWLYQTARLTASNYLRAEIRRQHREQEACMDSLVNEQEPDVWPHIAPLLDDAMARLGELDRNAIVLRYFENKRLTEVGAALGTSEDAARVRVNRALEKLRQIFASRGVTLGATLIAGAVSANSVQAAPVGLAVAISSTAAKLTTSAAGIGLGSKLASVLGKSILFSWFVPLISVIGILPGLVFAGFMGRLERKNFRDPQGFRPRLHWLYYKSFLWGFPLVCILMMAIIHYTHAAWGATVGKGLLAGFGIYLVLIGARSLIINRGPFQIGMFVYSLIIVVGLFSQALGWMPHSVGLLPIILASVVLLLVSRKRPMRMDYSLFLRAAQGLLQTSESTGKAPLPGILSRASLLEFGRFLGSRYLANNFRWESAGLALRLPPVRNRFLMNMAIIFMPPISPNCSYIRLGWDGTVVAHCGKSDGADLVELHQRKFDEVREMEFTLADAVSQAWCEVRSGDSAAAERLLGELPESEVFLVSPARAKQALWWQLGLGATILLMALCMAMAIWQPPSLSGLHPVSVTGDQVRAFLNDTTPNPDPKKFRTNSPGLALFTCMALPSTNLFNANGLRQMRDEVIGQGGFDKVRTHAWQVQSVFYLPLARRAIALGWLTWQDFGIQPADSVESTRSELSRYFSGDHWDRLMTRCEAWSWVGSERFDATRIQSDGLAQLWLLRSIGCLGVVDREKLVQQIASVQVLSGNPPGQPPMHDWRDVRGLFFTPCWPALQDTYTSLAALEILGGLDKIDREQCIRGILRRHRGKGYFTSPFSGGYNEYHIRGDARDTIAAFESLRILGALDRVRDLEKWQFRPYRYGIAKGQLTWCDVEAWVCQQRFEKLLQEHRDHPTAPFRSLLEP